MYTVLPLYAYIPYYILGIFPIWLHILHGKSQVHPHC